MGTLKKLKTVDVHQCRCVRSEIPFGYMLFLMNYKINIKLADLADFVLLIPIDNNSTIASSMMVRDTVIYSDKNGDICK